MTNRNYIYLLAIVCFGMVLRIVFFSGYQSGDDSAYIARAFLYSEGEFLAPYSHWGSRVLPVALTAFAYSIFEVNDFATVLFPFVFSILGVVVAYLIGRQVSDEKVGLLAAFFVSIFPMEVLFSTQLFPYSMLSSLCGLLFYLFLRAESKDNVKLLFFVGLVLGLAYLSRITALYSLIFFGLYALWHKEVFHRKYLLMALGFVVIFLIEAMFGYIQSGDFLQRLHVLMNKNAGHEAVRILVQDTSIFARDFQWFIEPFIRPITEQEIGPFFLILWPIVIYQLFWGTNKQVKLLLLWIIPIFLYISYGTTSPTDYQPLRRLPRYLSIIIIPVMVLIAYQLATLRYRKLAYLAGAGLMLFSLFALTIDNSRYVVEKESKLADFIANNPQHEYILPRSVYYDVLYFNQFEKLQNIILYVNFNDRSDTLKRIRIVSSDIREVSSLSKPDSCGFMIAYDGGYIKENIAENSEFKKVEVFPQTERLYDRLKKSDLVLSILSMVRDEKRMKLLKRSNENEIALYKHDCST